MEFWFFSGRKPFLLLRLQPWLDINSSGHCSYCHRLYLPALHAFFLIHAMRNEHSHCPNAPHWDYLSNHIISKHSHNLSKTINFIQQHYCNRVISNVCVNLLGLLGLYITLITEKLKQKRLKKDCCKCVMRNNALLAGQCLFFSNSINNDKLI